MSASLDDLVPELSGAARDLVDACGAAGLLPRITSTLRSRSEQTRLYRRSQQGLQPYPVAPPGYSAHEYGWAFDLVVSPFDAIDDVGYTWQTWGGGWNASDRVHFELLGASELARSEGDKSQQSDSLAARAGGLITTATDFYLGSNVAGLMKLIPGLSKNEALTALSAPYATFQQWLISSIKLPGWKP